MRPYNYPDSDIDEEEVTLQVRCPDCKETYPMTICKESLGNYIDNGDGTYTDREEPWCVTCLEHAQGE